MELKIGDRVRIEIHDEVPQNLWGEPATVTNIYNKYSASIVADSEGLERYISSCHLLPIKKSPLEPREINQDKSVIPHSMWLVLRRKEIQNAIISYAEAGLPIKQEWIDEWNGVKND